jgi:hypothetical protein
MTKKRFFVESLPVVNQTETLKNFFSATVDHLFQSGASETLTGYIGQKPSYFDSTKDFYIPEKDIKREYYQLEPTMISKVNGNVAYTLFYDDLINYLDSMGGNVEDHSRLFSGDYYSWSPPINLDAINNPNQYIWMGGLTDDEYEKTLLNLKAPRNVYTGDGVQNRFTLPSVILGFGGDDEHPSVLVNGEEVTADIVNGQAQIATPAAGSIIEVIRYGDLKAVYEGKTAEALHPFQYWEAYSYGFSGASYVRSSRVYNVGEVVYYGTRNYLCITQHTATDTFNPEYWKEIDQVEITSGMRLRLNDGVSLGKVFIVDGVGTSIVFTDDHTQDAGSETPVYVLNDRRSLDRNAWSLKNLWIHQNSLKWSDLDLNAKKAVRPIIEFLPNIELYDYGTNRLPDVQAIMLTDDLDVIDHWDLYPYDNNVWDEEQVTLSHINGKFFGEINGEYVGSIVVNPGTTDSYVLQPNDRLLVVQSNSTVEVGLNQRIYRVVSNEEIELPTGGNAAVIELISEGAPQLGDIVRLVPGNGVRDANGVAIPQVYSDFHHYNEYRFTGTQWVLAQAYNSGVPPLFQLYDSNKNKLDDELTYPTSSFAGNKLFGYEIGNGVADSVLGFPTVLNEYDKHIFQVYSMTDRVTYAENEEIVGYYYHRIWNTNEFSNNWFLNPDFSSQTKIANGVYSTPLNLQANPNNEEVEFIDKNKWFDHFNSIMTGQSNFAGSAYSINNYRDTEKYFGYGDYIIQHRNPLLKTMLVASDSRFDVVAAINFVEHEYTYFKNKFNQTILTFLENGTLSEIDPPATWVEKVLYNIRLNKTSDSPFSLSKMGGGQFYIPITPASIGVGITRKPDFFFDDTMGGIKFIIGHDGSRTPAFNDFRDDIILELEHQLYNAIEPALLTERPVFDITEHVYIGGEYSRDEYLNVMESSFYKWASENNLDYRDNNSFDPDDYFTWNMTNGGAFDGSQLAGNWRGIYLKYFDTTRPHSHPWEMLGFTDKPVWWDIEYGAAPYTRGNTKMWTDIEEGRIRQGQRAGLSARYARPNILNILPVSEEGALLDPVEARIVIVLPIMSDAASEWVYGDCSPVENLWRLSSAYAYAQAIASFLLKPAKFIEEGWDTINNRKIDNGQYINLTTGNRPKNSELYVHGEFLDRERVYACGIQQFIGEYIISLGADPAIFGNAVRGLNVMLGHKMGGFTSVSDMVTTTDNFGIIPSDDVNLVLYQSAPIKSDFYSGIIVTWNGSGWTMSGYDDSQPWFNIIPPMITSPRYKITTGTSEEITYNDWRASTNYAINTKISYNGKIYVALRSHLSSAVFESAFWDEVGTVTASDNVSVLVYSQGEDEVIKIPYGTTFYTPQEVTDFILGYERYLESRGWLFDEVENELVINWKLSVKEFLEWSSVEYEAGESIFFSPSTYKAKYKTDHGLVSSVMTSVNGKKNIVGYTGVSKTSEQVAVSRREDETVFQSTDGDIYGIRVKVREIEHAILFSNQTIFGNLIYNPLFNLRQPRIRILGKRSVDWTGRLDAPGYVIANNEIVPNFMKSTDDFLNMYDIEDHNNATFATQARHNIGYSKRDYLSNLAINEIQQFEFYQGMIQQKGSVGTFDKLLRSDYVDQNRELAFREEWAFKIDQYGGVARNKTASFLIQQSDMSSDSEIVHFSVGNTIGNDMIEIYDNTTVDTRWVERADDPLNVFQTRTTYAPRDTDLPVSGYVRTNEVNNIVFSYEDIQTLTHISAGDTVWVHSVDASRGLTPLDTQWYFVGVYNNSTTYWNTANLVLTTNSSYVVENMDNDIVFRSPSALAPFITTSTGLIPEAGKTYRTEFRVRKIAADTNALGSYLRPAFDVYDSNGVLTNVNTQGDRYGFGYEQSTDMINTANWTIGEYYTVGATWVAPVIQDEASTIIPRIRVNRNLADTGPWSTAMYEISAQTTFEEDKSVYWNVFKAFNADANGAVNSISNIVTTAEEPTVSTIRFNMVNPHGLNNNDIGRYIYIDGDTQTEPSLEGFQQIMGVSGTHSFEILSIGSKGYDFFGEVRVPVPTVTVLKPIRFKNSNELLNSTYKWVSGDIAYVDGDDTHPWKVYQFEVGGVVYTQDDYVPGDAITVHQDVWNVIRVQPKRISAERLKSALVYDRQTKLNSRELAPEPLVVNRFNVLSPITGFLLGRANNEIDFATDVDPAVYSTTGRMDDTIQDETNTINLWGEKQVGYVWWDLSTVRFLENETDNVTFGITETSRYLEELNYRKNALAKVAPGTSVDIYEWVKSYELPEDYTGDGELRYDYTQYVKGTEFVNNVQKTVYYFWVKNVRTVPMTHDRLLSVYTVANLIANPLSQDYPWIAPLTKNSFVIGGIRQYLDDAFDSNSGTIIQIEHDYDYDGVVHEEWLLLKEYDQKDQIPDWLWDALRDNLVGFDDKQTQVPAPIVPPTIDPQDNEAPIWKL